MFSNCIKLVPPQRDDWSKDIKEDFTALDFRYRMSGMNNIFVKRSHMLFSQGSILPDDLVSLPPQGATCFIENGFGYLA